ncbi:hypothetical protein [Mycobacterium sp.]|uniref:hypothetical protein n=1 Tax=Mycobacterium sp. TaxID=1785 RepID=UPI002CD6DAD2|nr:hypothetical protein [Mycobacterium sp.]HTY33789.1 hypothetical protein [Mycobacterium sp.]
MNVITAILDLLGLIKPAPLGYQYEFVDVPSSVTNLGTGEAIFSPWLAKPESVADSSQPLNFVNDERRIIVISFTISSHMGPNWFGVAFRERIKSFNSINIFFHPDPSPSIGYLEKDYPARTAQWLALFRYVQNLGFQLDAGNCDQILLMPIFDEPSWANCGVFPTAWNEIALVAINCAKAVALFQGPPSGQKSFYTQIAQGTLAELQGGNVPLESVKDVVLSCFSAGRLPMLNFYRAARGASAFVRELWDFDGFQATLPASSATLNVIHYDQSTTPNAPGFHVPPPRWSSFPPGAPKTVADVHGLIPNCLFWHATTLSNVGK